MLFLYLRIAAWEDDCGEWYNQHGMDKCLLHERGELWRNVVRILRNNDSQHIRMKQLLYDGKNEENHCTWRLVGSAWIDHSPNPGRSIIAVEKEKTKVRVDIGKCFPKNREWYNWNVSFMISYMQGTHVPCMYLHCSKCDETWNNSKMTWEVQ